MIRFAGAPIEITVAAFAMKTALLRVISSEWQPEKFPLREEVVQAKLSSSSSEVELIRSDTDESPATTIPLFSQKVGQQLPTRKNAKKNIPARSKTQSAKESFEKTTMT